MLHLTIPHIVLLIKGNEREAVHAMRERGFNPADWLQLPERVETTTHHVVSVAIVRIECEPGAQRWFAELPNAPPFPIGSLLHYSVKNLPPNP